MVVLKKASAAEWATLEADGTAASSAAGEAAAFKPSGEAAVKAGEGVADRGAEERVPPKPKAANAGKPQFDKLLFELD